MGTLEMALLRPVSLSVSSWISFLTAATEVIKGKQKLNEICEEAQVKVQNETTAPTKIGEPFLGEVKKLSILPGSIINLLQL